MKLYKAFLSGMAMVACLTASAQEAKPGDKVVNEFVPHFYVQAQAGGQYTLGEISFSKLLSPNAQLGVGYEFTDWFGLRLSVNAWQGKGGWDLNHNGFAHTYKWKWNYVAPQLDFKFNLSNILCGFNPNRVVNVSAFVGGGVNVGWNNDDARRASESIMTQTATTNYAGQNLEYLWDGTKVRGVGRAGLGIDFRVSDAVSLGIEGSANMTTDHYNSKKASKVDWYFNALAGVKINLGKTHKTRVIPAPEPQVVERVVEKYVDKPVTEKAQNFRRDVFFTINKANIRTTEEQKVKEVADYLKANPDANVIVIGYADKGTGTPKINSALAIKRAKAVTAELVNKYGIDESRISTGSCGAEVQPFKENDKNRVVIAIAN